MKTNELKLAAAVGAVALAMSATPAMAQQISPDAFGAVATGVEAAPSANYAPPAPVNGGVPAQSQQNLEAETVEGTVGQLSYSPSGGVNGFYFENGTLVQVPPHVNVGDLVEEGSSVEVAGYRTTGAFGEDVIHAQEIANTDTGESIDANDVSTGYAPTPPAVAPAGLAGPLHGPAAGGPISGGPIVGGSIVGGSIVGGPVGPPLQ